MSPATTRRFCSPTCGMRPSTFTSKATSSFPRASPPVGCLLASGFSDLARFPTFPGFRPQPFSRLYFATACGPYFGVFVVGVLLLNSDLVPALQCMATTATATSRQAHQLDNPSFLAGPLFCFPYGFADGIFLCRLVLSAGMTGTLVLVQGRRCAESFPVRRRTAKNGRERERKKNKATFHCRVVPLAIFRCSSLFYIFCIIEFGWCGIRVVVLA